MSFAKDKVDLFLGVVRKYMQVRGSLSQKDLAEMTQTGVSTMSRFLNQQTKDLNPQLIAQIVAVLNIPLHEIIDFVEEDYTEQFVRLVKFYKGDEMTGSGAEQVAAPARSETTRSSSGGSEMNARAQIKVGNKMTTLNYQAEDNSGDELRDRLKNLSLKQKGFLNEFLRLDSDGRDLVADVGRNIISYLRQKGIDF